MKNVLKVLFALIIISCNSNRDPIEEEISLVGTWKIERTITISGADQKTVLNDESPDTCKQKSTYQYTADQKYTVNDFNNTITGCEQTSFSTPYSYDNVKKILYVGLSTAQVQDLTANSLIIFIADNYDYDGDGTLDFLRYIYKR